MFDRLEIFRLAGGLAQNATARQSMIAGNIANADTPGYRARDVAPFSQSYRAGLENAPLRTTRAGHFSRQPAATPVVTVDAPGLSSPNGNTVSLDTEMVRAVETRQQYEMALSIYQASLNILRTSLGRGR